METETLLCGATIENLKKDLKRDHGTRKDVCWFCKEIELNAIPHPNWKEFGYIVCKKCINEHEIRVKKIDRRKRPRLEIQPTANQAFIEAFGDDPPDWIFDPVFMHVPKESGGALNWFSEKPVVYLSGLETDEKSAANTITHEWIHWVLFCKEGWLTSIAFDNICGYVIS